MTQDSGTDKFASIQEHCLLYLVTHVEDYSPQTLALLLRHLRQALLSSVAPLHLYQLDHTEVANGISTQTIWEDIPILTKLTGFHSSDSPQELLINTVYHPVLHKYPDGILTVPVL